MTPDTFRKLAPAWARTIRNEHFGFLTEATLPELAKAWPEARVLVRCHSYRFTVTADQAAAAIAAQGDQLRDAALLAGYWSRALDARAAGDETPPRTAYEYLRAMASAERRHAADASTERLASLSRHTAQAYDTAAHALIHEGA